MSAIFSTLRRICGPALLAAALAGGSSAHASISLSTTRVIFDGRDKEASIVVRNGKANILVQSWIESNTEGDLGELPFAVSPPLAKMLPDSQQLLRVLYAGGKNTLPQDKESVLWLNVQEIPEAVPGENVLQMAIRQRIKLFFRPAGLQGAADDAPAALQWSIVQQGGKPMLQVSNPSAFHVSFSQIAIGAGAPVAVRVMIAPGETNRYALGKDVAPGSAALAFSVVNDYGGVDEYKARLSGADPVNAAAAKAPK